MQSRFNFNGFQMSTCNNFEYTDAHTMPSKILPNTTALQESWSMDEPFFQKSTLNISQAYEISFEGNYMSEHREVFTKELTNYMEFARTLLQKYEPSVLNRFPEGLYDLSSGMTCEDLMTMAGSNLTESAKNKLILNLKEYEKLKEFLNFVADYCPSDIAMELIHVSQQVLEEYLASQEKDNVYVESSVLLDIASNASAKLHGIEMLNMTHTALPEEERREVTKKLKCFLEVFCATSAMMIGRFFENPYFENDVCGGLKRSLSPFSLDDEDSPSCDEAPRKIRKNSF